MSRSSPADYLREVLALDPSTEAERVLDLRERFLGDTVATPEPRGVGVSTREQDLARLRSLAAGFWDLAPEELERELERCEAVEQPDLLRWAQRLRRVAEARDAFEDLGRDPDLPRSLVVALRRLALADPREAVELRRDHQRGALARITEKGARRVLRLYPEIAALERDHLQRLARLRHERQLGRPATLVGAGVVLYLVIRALLTVLRQVLE